MPRTLLILLCALVCFACGPDAAGGGASPEQASVVIQGLNVDTDTDEVTRVPTCMGVAISPTAIVTAKHCEPTGSDGVYSFVDFPTWNATSNGFALADFGFDVGEVRVLVPRVPLLNWATPGRAVDGPGVFVVLEGTRFATVPTVVAANQVSGMLEHTFSGGGVFQSGYAVGALLTCNTDPFSDDPDRCTDKGGRFARMP